MTNRMQDFAAQDFAAKFGLPEIFVVTGQHQRTAFFTREEAEQYLVEQIKQPERFSIYIYRKAEAITGEDAAIGSRNAGRSACLANES